MQLPGASADDSQMAMNTSTANTDITLAREFQKHFSDPTWEHGFFYNGKDRKCASKRKSNDREYHVQGSKYMSHISDKITGASTQLPEFSFCGPREKPHGVRG